MSELKSFITFLMLCLAVLTGARAQNTILTSGGDGIGTGGSVAYSVGQVDFTSYNGDGGIISLGVQQPYVVIMVGTNEPEIHLAASTYPNPVTTDVNLSIDTQISLTGQQNFSFELYDINGKVLLQQDIISPLTTIPMESLTSALYVLRVLRDNVEIKTFKIFKQSNR